MCFDPSADACFDQKCPDLVVMVTTHVREVEGSNPTLYTGLFCCNNCFECLKRPKIKKGWGWPIYFLKKLVCSLIAIQKFELNLGPSNIGL